MESTKTATPPVARDIDEYLSRVPGEARATLERLRADIHAAAPDATEAISYQLPTFKQDGPLVGFGAWKNHCALYVMSTAVTDAHEKDLRRYDTSKGTVRFPVDKPLPATLVRKIVKAAAAARDAR